MAPGEPSRTSGSQTKGCVVKKRSQVKRSYNVADMFLQDKVAEHMSYSIWKRVRGSICRPMDDRIWTRLWQSLLVRIRSV